MGISRIAALVAAVAAAVFVGIEGGIAFAEVGGETGHVLVVTSIECETVPIAGDKAGTTPYTAPCSHMEVVSLTAEPTASNGIVVCSFAWWMIDYIEQPAGQRTIQITMDADHSAMAVYEAPVPTLTVTSAPITGITILRQNYTVNLTDGVTTYTKTFWGSVTLIAPSTARDGDDEYRFVRWELDGDPVNSRSIHIHMEQDCTAVAVYEERVPVLSVSSKPMGGVSISGDVPGTTDYTATYSRGQAFTLTAPASVTTEEGEHPFLHWSVKAVTQPEGQTSVEVLTDSYTCSAVAVYFEFHPVLTVKSSPSGISIGGDKPGTAEYTAECIGGEVVHLQAPLEAVISQTDYVFSHWTCTTTTTKTVDTPELELVMNESTRAVARYVVKPYMLTVLSEPFAGISIDGTAPGTTDYTVPTRPYDGAILEAPSEVQHDGGTYTFLRWILDGVDQPVYETELLVDMTGDITCVAVYAISTRLTVSSSPLRISISGDKPGITPYTAACLTSDPVVLEAPPTYTYYSSIYDFSHWEIDGVAQAAGQDSITVVPVSDCSAKAVYDRVPQIRVQSEPIRGVPISGDKPGVTNYVEPCRGINAVYLEAPPTFSANGHAYRFVRWHVYGTATPSGNTGVLVSITVSEDEPYVRASAIYEALVVDVGTSLWTPVTIGGSRPGTTSYTIDYGPHEVITLEAPATVVQDGTPHRFARWVLDNEEQPALQTTIEFTPTGYHRLVAVYMVAMIRLVGPADRGESPLPPGGGTFTVDVFLSCPVAVGGMTTALQFLDASGIDAAFPIATGPDGNSWFNYHKIDFNSARWPSIMGLFAESGPQRHRAFGFMSMGADGPVADDTWVCTVTYEYGPSAEGTYAIRCDADRSITLVGTADGQELSRFDVPGTVVIGLAADLNHDCMVNEADMLVLRDMLGQHVSPGMRGDLNSDGVIDVRDLIILRNRMGTACR